MTFVEEDAPHRRIVEERGAVAPRGAYLQTIANALDAVQNARRETLRRVTIEERYVAIALLALKPRRPVEAIELGVVVAFAEGSQCGFELGHGTFTDRSGVRSAVLPGIRRGIGTARSTRTACATCAALVGDVPRRASAATCDRRAGNGEADFE